MVWVFLNLFVIYWVWVVDDYVLYLLCVLCNLVVINEVDFMVVVLIFGVYNLVYFEYLLLVW